MSKPVNPSIQTRLNALHERIQQACIDSGRDRQSVTLIGVSKTKPARNVAEAHNLGLTHFGENYLQEAVSKIEELRELHAQWHYIGAIQSNKTKDVAKYFDWVHTVDRLKIGQRLSAQCPEGRPVQSSPGRAPVLARLWPTTSAAISMKWRDWPSADSSPMNSPGSSNAAAI